MRPPLVVFLVAAAAAAACDVCDRAPQRIEGPHAVVVLPDDDLACACEFVFVYSTGPTPGQATITAGPTLGALAVYGSPAATAAPIARFSSADVLQGAVLFSQTGVLRVVLASPANAALELTVAAVDQPPLIEERDEGVIFDQLFPFASFFYPWGSPGPLPVRVRDYDNWDRGLRAELTILTDFSDSEATVAMRVPDMPRVDFEQGQPDELVRWVIIQGPGSAVEAALDAVVLEPIRLSRIPNDLLEVRVTDFGDPDSPAVSLYRTDVTAFAVGVIEVERGSGLLNSGLYMPTGGSDAVYLVYDAYRIKFIELDAALGAGGCADYVRVYDGPDVATGRLLSTELFSSGEICGQNHAFLPTYTGTTGGFVVELVLYGFESSGFDTIVSPTPVGFQAWLLDGDRVVEAVQGGPPVLLPQIMVTTLPDPAQIFVNITASAGAVSLRFADSFVDVVVAADGSTLSLAVTEAVGAPAMLRMGDVLREVQYTAPPANVTAAVLRIDALSGGVAAEALEIEVRISAVAINAPETLSINAFRPVTVPVAVSSLSAHVVVAVTATTGLGRLSLDPRAGSWVDVGYAPNVTVGGSVADVNEALSSLVYKADLGGSETVRVEVGAIVRSIDVEVDPNCSGAHTIYSREGAITERAGPHSEQYPATMTCSWSIHGPRELRFPRLDVPFGTIVLVEEESGFPLYLHFLGSPGVLRPSTPFFLVEFSASGDPGVGIVATFRPDDSIDDPPVLVVPTSPLVAVRRSTLRLLGLYVDDFADGEITASLETDAGSLQTEGNRLVSIKAATFEELDAWVTGIDFLAGQVQTTATLTLRAADAFSANVALFEIDVLPCSGTSEVVLEDGSAAVTVEDGSDTADYVDGLACAWRLTGAPAPAALEVTYLDLHCAGDHLTVYDGSSAAGRALGTYCRSSDVAEQVGTFVSSTGSFFVTLSTDEDGAVDDGFSFVYAAVPAGDATALGLAPSDRDPQRSDATLVALDSATVLVFGGHNGVRAVASTLVFAAGQGWQALPLLRRGPRGRSRAAGAAVSASRVVVHGGVDVDGELGAETWVGDITSGITWTQLPQSGPATAAAAMHVHNGIAHLVDASGVWILDMDPHINTWNRTDVATPASVTPTSSAYRFTDGVVYAVATDGVLWTLSLETLTWAALDVRLPIGCDAWTCSGAMLGATEFVVGGARVNVSSLAVDSLPAAAAGQAVGGEYLDQPALYLYASGAMTAVPLTLEASSHAPRVSPAVGGTVVTLSGEQLGSCPEPMCQFGSSAVAAVVSTERLAFCRSPAGSETVSVSLVCASGRRFATADVFAFFPEPMLESIEPTSPDPGESVLVTIGGVAQATLALVDTPLCRFGDDVVDGALDGALLRCIVPETLSTGSSVTLEVSLDGQQFGSTTQLMVGGSGDGSGVESSVIVMVATVVSVLLLLLVGAILRYRRLANSRVAAGPAPWEIPFAALQVGEMVGVGGYGAVHHGQFRGGEVAIKMTKDSKILPRQIAAFRRESALMAELRHPNIVLFMGACTEPPNIAIVLEYLPNGTLYDLLHDDEVLLRPDERVSFALDIVKGMAYLHGAEPPIIHRDLKSLNVLVDKNWTLKVSDFGMTEIFGDFGTGAGPSGGGAAAALRTLSRLAISDRGTGRSSGRSSGRNSARSNGSVDVQASGDGSGLGDLDADDREFGSVQWAAPEVVAGGFADKASDVYSFAITLWEIATRDNPWPGVPPMAVAIGLTTDKTFRPSSQTLIPPHLETIIHDCWQPEPELRPSFPTLRERLMLAVREEDEETAESEMSLSMSLPMTDACVVALRVDKAAALWERNPAAMHSMMSQFQSTVGQLCDKYQGRAMPGDSDLTLCVFATPVGAIAFASSLQLALHERGWPEEEPDGLFRGLLVACGVARGRAQTSQDAGSRRTRLEGVAVDAAVLLGRRSRGGQALMPPSLVKQYDAAALGVVAHQEGELIAIYPEALHERHAAIVADDRANEEDEGTANWVIPSDELEVGQLIGAGSFGTVFKATWRGAVVAAKRLHRKRLAAKEALDLQMEGGVASKLQHPNVCLFLGVSRDVAAGKVFVVTEYMPKGSVFDAVVTARKEVASEIKTKVAQGIALGLQYLHAQDPAVVHRSLTARNVLLSNDWTAKLSDFGLARTKDGNATMTKVASTAYTAPEVLRGERYGEKIDVYAFGVIVWEMVAQKVAFGGAGARMGALAQIVLAGKRPPIEGAWRKDKELGALVLLAEQCWKVDPGERPDAGDIRVAAGQET